MLLILLSTIVSTLIYIYVLRPRDYWKHRNVKYIQPTILFGSFFEHIFGIKSYPDVLQHAYQKFKGERYFGLFQMTLPILVIKDPELIKKITIKDFGSFAGRQGQIRHDVDPIWSRAIFSVTGGTWRDLRTTLTPTFTISKMRKMFFLVEECANELVQHILDKKQDVVTLELKDTFVKIASDSIANCAFGVKCNSLKQPKNEFHLNAKNAFDFSGFKQFLFLYPSIMKLFGIKVISNKMADYFQAVVKNMIKIREENGIVRPDILHLLLESRKGRLVDNDKTKNIEDTFASDHEYDLKGDDTKKCLFNDLDITAQVLGFYLAGFDVTSTLPCFICYELVVNTDMQDRLRQEIDNTLQQCNGKITYDALMNMNYLDMIISETLRKWPPASSTGRYCTKEYVIEPEIEGEERLVIKHGTNILLPIYSIHRDPKYYPNPETFDPERFSSKNKAKINNVMYMPFGAGSRNCIGSRFALMETKAVIFHVLENFEIVPVKESTIPFVASKNNINTVPENDFWFGFKQRSTLSIPS